MSRSGGSVGPTFGRTAFDYRRDHVWDLKCHPLNGSSGGRASVLILNDAEAIEACIHLYGCVGFIVAFGRVEYDDEAGTFKLWHDELKGGRSKYEIERVARGARSRRRKVAMTFERITVYVLDGPALAEGVRGGWIGSFQQGMRNADGSPRRQKYTLLTQRVPADLHVNYSIETSQ